MTKYIICGLLILYCFIRLYHICVDNMEIAEESVTFALEIMSENMNLHLMIDELEYKLEILELKISQLEDNDE